MIIPLLYALSSAAQLGAAPGFNFNTEFLGEATLAMDAGPDERPPHRLLGGISGLAWDDARAAWLALSDARDAPRIYTLRIDTSPDTGADAPRVRVTGVIDLPLGAGADAEAIAPAPGGGWFVSYESPASVVRFDAGFARFERLDIGDAAEGLAPNYGFEAIARAGDKLIAISEEGVGKPLSGNTGAGNPLDDHRSLLVSIDIATGAHTAALYNHPLYALGVTRVVDAAALDENRVLVLEQWVPASFSVRLFDPHEPNPNPQPESPSPSSTQLFSREFLGVDRWLNVEALALGPTDDDGARLLVIATDNNFGHAPTRRVGPLALTLPAEKTTRFFFVRLTRR